MTEPIKPVFKDYYEATQKGPSKSFKGPRYTVIISPEGNYKIFDPEAVRVLGSNFNKLVQGKLELEPDAQSTSLDLEGILVTGLGNIIEITNKQENKAEIKPIKHDLNKK
jgi:hypothetical protein